jgi:hypothetical protein
LFEGEVGLPKLNPEKTELLTTHQISATASTACHQEAARLALVLPNPRRYNPAGD